MPYNARGFHVLQCRQFSNPYKLFRGHVTVTRRMLSTCGNARVAIKSM